MLVGLLVGASGDDGAKTAALDEPKLPKHGTPLLVLYGSNLGSSESFARETAQKAEFSGFDVELAPMDSYVGKLPKDGAVAIACASYNGMPPDNAAKFANFESNSPTWKSEFANFDTLWKNPNIGNTQYSDPCYS